VRPAGRCHSRQAGSSLTSSCMGEDRGGGPARCAAAAGATRGSRSGPPTGRRPQARPQLPSLGRQRRPPVPGRRCRWGSSYVFPFRAPCRWAISPDQVLRHRVQDGRRRGPQTERVRPVMIQRHRDPQPPRPVPRPHPGLGRTAVPELRPADRRGADGRCASSGTDPGGARPASARTVSRREMPAMSRVFNHGLSLTPRPEPSARTRKWR
jgi:hypothetical protein